MPKNAQEPPPQDLLACIMWARQFPGLSTAEKSLLQLLAGYSTVTSAWIYTNRKTLMVESSIRSPATFYKVIRSLEAKGALFRQRRGKSAGGYQWEYDLPIRRDLAKQDGLNPRKNPKPNPHKANGKDPESDFDYAGNTAKFAANFSLEQDADMQAQTH